jgi:hypothetical protein
LARQGSLATSALVAAALVVEAVRPDQALSAALVALAVSAAVAVAVAAPHAAPARLEARAALVVRPM